jgi:hypothetical protein
LPPLGKQEQQSNRHRSVEALHRPHLTVNTVLLEMSRLGIADRLQRLERRRQIVRRRAHGLGNFWRRPCELRRRGRGGAGREERELEAERGRLKVDRDGSDFGTPAATASSVENGTDSPAAAESGRFDPGRIDEAVGVSDRSAVKRENSGCFLSSRSMVEKAPGTGASEKTKSTDGSPSPEARNAEWIRSSRTASGYLFAVVNSVSSATCMATLWRPEGYDEAVGGLPRSSSSVVSTGQR